MPIKIVRDYAADSGPGEEHLRPIVVDGAASSSSEQYAVQADKPKAVPESIPTQTAWAMVACLCTSTGRSFQLAFRKEGKTYVLASIDRQVGSNTSEDMSGIDGPFDWSMFACPECGRTWGTGKLDDKGGMGPPVIHCSCSNLFCTTKGLRRDTKKGDDSWWWKCPRCQTNSRVTVGIDSLRGQMLKGK